MSAIQNTTPNLNPYASSQASMTAPKPKRGYGKQWHVTIDGQDHTITLNHNAGSMRVSLYFDGDCVYKEPDPFKMHSSGDFSFNCNDHLVLASIKETSWGSLYTLMIDGALIAQSDPWADSKESFNAVFVVLLFAFVIFGFAFSALGSTFYLGPVRLDIAGALMFALSSLELLRRLVKKFQISRPVAAC